MAKYNRKVSLDVSEDMLERIDSFKEFNESYSDFHRLALINEIIRRSGQTNFLRPHSLPPLIPKEVPTQRAAIKVHKPKLQHNGIPFYRTDDPSSIVYQDDHDADQYTD
jgi:hypothetical protein